MQTEFDDAVPPRIVWWPEHLAAGMGVRDGRTKLLLTVEHSDGTREALPGVAFDDIWASTQAHEIGVTKRVIAWSLMPAPAIFEGFR